ncbi:PHP domain-containing protein [Paenibacillus alkaliterrae]|uniref:PHP domain-containing protein n=1 Tax=Paenibacillus alkaliterrae TaxID=320909 RepID=UPI001F2949C2|nr:PHP domain-containing protein [Paenibacillus alkaliterrae]MCF2936896.1 PHP domain-containing protein [Paenibacillus alkaliterrae]
MALMRGLADLHTHTTASDGMQSPAENVRLAKAAGLAAVAITDHDTVAGVAEAVLEGMRTNIIVVPGVELSTAASGIDIHILGYFTNNEDERWIARLTSLRGTRDRRNVMIVEKLRGLGIPITMEEVLAAAHGSSAEDSLLNSEGSVGRPHIAEVLVRKGIVSSMKEAFDRYLASGAAAYVNPPRLHPIEAMEWIKEAGGTSVIAHPGLYGNDALVEELIQHGVQGIEAYHSDHGSEEESRYTKLADIYGLIVTGGSDFHGIRRGQIFHGAVGSRAVDVHVLQQLRPSREKSE